LIDHLLSGAHKLYPLLQLVRDYTLSVIFYLGLGQLGRYCLWLFSGGRLITQPKDACKRSVQFCGFMGLVILLAIFIGLVRW
jgi:hypothetical protein